MTESELMEDYLQVLFEEIADWRKRAEDPLSGMDVLRDVTSAIWGDSTQVHFMAQADFVDFEHPIGSRIIITRDERVRSDDEFRGVVRSGIGQALHAVSELHLKKQLDGETKSLVSSVE
jgi:hypothetical protein